MGSCLNEERKYLNSYLAWQDNISIKAELISIKIHGVNKRLYGRLFIFFSIVAPLL